MTRGEIENLPASFRTASSTLLRSAATAIQEIDQTSLTDSGQLDGLIADTAEELDRVEQQERAAAAAPAVRTLQGTLLTDIGRFLAELRSGHRALTPKFRPKSPGLGASVLHGRMRACGSHRERIAEEVTE
ncbi:hypothetical protein [Streptomyces sp. NPDC058613]|uniref:hypothetical protein n=1 Tax=Streptomyces sp. NPDC058613 TaxID=3346556 RepID=UPI003658140F